MGQAQPPLATVDALLMGAGQVSASAPDFVRGELQTRPFGPRLFELCILTCEALVSFAVAAAGRPYQN